MDIVIGVSEAMSAKRGANEIIAQKVEERIVVSYGPSFYEAIVIPGEDGLSRSIIVGEVANTVHLHLKVYCLRYEKNLEVNLSYMNSLGQNRYVKSIGYWKEEEGKQVGWSNAGMIYRSNGGVEMPLFEFMAENKAVENAVRAHLGNVGYGSR